MPDPTQLVIHVTDEDIQHSKSLLEQSAKLDVALNWCAHCPIARAAQRALNRHGDENIRFNGFVLCDYTRTEDLVISKKAPESALEFASRADEGQWLPPFSFTLELV